MLFVVEPRASAVVPVCSVVHVPRLPHEDQRRDCDELEKEGADERAQGEAREAIGKTRRKVGEALEDLGQRVKR